MGCRIPRLENESEDRANGRWNGRGRWLVDLVSCSGHEMGKSCREDEEVGVCERKKERMGRTIDLIRWDKC